jgi:flagellar basal-body rod protein FlgB
MPVEMPFDLNAELSLSAQSLAVQSKRLQMLATNIANADTPNYKARDVDFRSVLNRVSDSAATATMTKTQPTHMDAPVEAADSEDGVKYRQPLAPSLDGNTVDMQLEQSAFAETTVRYQSSLAFATDTFRGLMLAITGQGQ